jgi:hypothetical protein
MHREEESSAARCGSICPIQARELRRRWCSILSVQGLLGRRRAGGERWVWWPMVEELEVGWSWRGNR